MIAFIQRIRESDLRTRWKWLIIFTSISMVIVISIWIVALRVITENIENSEAVAAETQTSSFFERMKTSLDELLRRTGIAAKNVKTRIAGKDIPLEAPLTETTPSN